MTTNGQGIVIDADAHVVECERTWEFMDPSERQYRPTPLQTAEKGGVKQQFWLVDGKVRGLRFPAFTPEALEQRAKQAGRKFADMDASREMGNVDMRLEHMDQTGVDVEVLHNTMFIEAVTERVGVEVALCKSWNRWLADIWQHGKGRLLWSCMPPILSMPDALDQIRWSKEHGACAVLMRPIEGSRLLADPYFYPIYDLAQSLDIPIAVHIANGNAWLNDLYRHPVSQAAGLHRFRVPTVASFSDVMLSDIHQQFPRLRWGFIEASAQWLPWVLHEAKNRFKTLDRPWSENIATGVRHVRHLRKFRRPAVSGRERRRGLSGYRHRLRPHGHIERCRRDQDLQRAHGYFRGCEAQDPQRQCQGAVRAVIGDFTTKSTKVTKFRS